VKHPDEVISTHVFHQGTAKEFKDFMGRHRQDVIQMENASDRVIVTIRTVPDTKDEVVFVQGVYPS
jgi:hypothetical protein